MHKIKQDKSPGLNGVTTNQLQGAEEPVVKAMHTLVAEIQQEQKIHEN